MFLVNCMQFVSFNVIQLTANATCFTVKQSQSPSMIVDNVQPDSVSVYLYYDPRESSLLSSRNENILFHDVS